MIGIDHADGHALD